MGTFYTLDFEKPLAEIEKQIRDAESGNSAPAAPAGVEGFDASANPNAADLADLHKQHTKLLEELYTDLNPWDTVRVSRHPNRPQSRDYIEHFVRDFGELHGDRRYGDDPAIICGFGRIGTHKCLVVGHHKGRTTQERIQCHFGCAHPEGYRKALLKMKLAEKFGTPIVTFVDTPGAYPGLEAERRGQAEAIAVNLREMARIKVPILSIVIGEGGSGGALGIAVADKVAMLRNSWYSVISPEGCAAILWKQANEQTNRSAAEALNLTARDNLKLGIIDAVVEEPLGGAHRDPDAASDMLRDWIVQELDILKTKTPDELLEGRYDRFRNLGAFNETPVETPATASEDDS